MTSYQILASLLQKCSRGGFFSFAKKMKDSKLLEMLNVSKKSYFYCQLQCSVCVCGVYIYIYIHTLAG